MTCVATNSNCVIWEGPNIPCINLVKGDSVTIAIQNIATILCGLSTPDLDVTSVDFKCVVDGLPPDTLPTAIQALVDKVCDIETLVGQIVPGSDPILNLPACLQEDLVTSLPLSEYAVLVAEKVCELQALIEGLQTQFDDLEERVTLLEEALATLDPSGSTLPTVDSTCLGGTVGAQLNVALQLTIDELCELKEILGSNEDLISAISAQCVGNSDEALSTDGVMSSLPGWVSNPLSISDTIKNLWIALCDARSALEDVNTAVAPKCKDVVLDFEVSFNPDRTTATLSLFNYSYIPDVFTNTPQSIVTFFDGTNTYSAPINPILMAASIMENEVYSLDAIGIDRTKNIKVTVTASVDTPDGICTKLKSKDYTYTCLTAPVTGIAITVSSTSAVISWTNPATPEPVINYTYQIIKDSLVVRTITVTQNVVTVSNLEPGSDYTVSVVANFLCGSSAAATNTFSMACYQITSAFAYFDTCIGGQADEFLGGSVVISGSAETDVDFRIDVEYVPISSDCSGGGTSVSLFGYIPQGQNQGVVNGCSSGITVVGGGKVCSVFAELLNGCSPTSVGANCASPTSLTVSII